LKNSIPKNILRAGLLALGLCTASTGIAQTSQTADVTFRVRVAFEGDIRTIDTGVKLVCTLSYRDLDGENYFDRVETQLVPAGTTPKTPNGYIDAEVTLKDQPLRLNDNIHVENGNMLWACFAIRETGGGEALNYMTSYAGKAISPADIGTCATIRGEVSMQGEATTTRVRCATERSGL
jgi:hypothetical protein